MSNITDKTPRSFAELDSIIGAKSLSPELQEFVKVFPPPYRYEEWCGDERIWASNSEHVSLKFNGYTEDRQRDAFGQLICSLLNKHFEASK